MLERFEAQGRPVTHVADYTFGAMQVSKYRLHNGLTVLHLPDHRAPLFSYQTWMRVGSRHERKGKTGIAHLFEHLMFKGTDTRAEGVFDRTLEGLGARVNAATWLDWTFYYEDVPGPQHLPLVVELEADRLANMRLVSDQLESERKVVINERKERVDNDPGGKLSEVLWAKAFTQHPYGQPTIGWMPDIEGLSLEDCKAFHRTWYAPNNAVVVVVGDVQAEPLLSELVDHYGALEAAEIPETPTVTEPQQTEPRREVLTLPLSGERLMVGLHAPGAGDPLHPALEVLNEALFEGDSARLRRALVTDGELASGFYAFVPAFAEAGLYEISVDLREGHTAEEAEAVLLAEFAKVVEHGLTEREFETARNKLETRFYQQLRTASRRAHGLGYWEVTLGDFTQLFSGGERLRQVTREQVLQVAKQVLRPEGRTVVIGRPQAK